MPLTCIEFIISNLTIYLYQAGTTINKTPDTNVNENFCKTHTTMFIGDTEEKHAASQLKPAEKGSGVFITLVLI